MNFKAVKKILKSLKDAIPKKKFYKSVDELREEKILPTPPPWGLAPADLEKKVKEKKKFQKIIKKTLNQTRKPGKK
jgi:hypothetical protein